MRKNPACGGKLRDLHKNGGKHSGNRRLRSAFNFRSVSERIAACAAVRDDLAADMSAISLVHSLAIRLRNGHDMEPLLRGVLDTAITVTRADFGHIQLMDPSGGLLKIYVQTGLCRDFLEFFDCVHPGQSACGLAMKSLHRVVVEDVACSPVFPDSQSIEIMLRAGIRAVQATPLITRSGKLVGMLSTHHRKPGAWPPRELRLLDFLAAGAGSLIERRGLEAASFDAYRRSSGYSRFSVTSSMYSRTTGRPD